MSEVFVGLEFLPSPIVEHIRRSVGDRIELPHVYHVTDLCYCLRKAYFKRVFPEISKEDLGRDTKGLLNIYRGRMFDREWSPLFKENQRTFVVTRQGVSIVGTFDFVFEGVLYDLKMPASTYYKKRAGAGQGYRRQVQAYLALAHANNQFLEVEKARVVMVAEDCVIEEVEGDPEILGWLFFRAFCLDEALVTGKVEKLEGPEEAWECNPKYCAFHGKCRETKNAEEP